MLKVFKITLFLGMLFASQVSFGHEAPKTDPEKQNYIDQYVKIFNVEADVYSGLLGKQAGVRFSVKNLGNETIEDIEVTFYFLDKNGLRFSEKSFHPIGKFRDVKTLKPNYTVNTNKDEFYTVGNLGDEWSKGIEFEVTDIEFAE